MYRIAICEDDSAWREKITTSLQEIFVSQPHAVTQFTSGSGLMNWFRENGCTFNIVLLDIELGDISGIDIAKTINELSPDCQIIFITGYLNYASEVYTANHLYLVHKNELERYLPLAMSKAIEILLAQ